MSDSNTILVEIENISKKYCRSRSAARKHLAKHLFRSFVPGKSYDASLKEDQFWALQDVSLELRRGEVLGVIGLNGSGKSTLLKSINGLLLPDKGSLTIHGEVGGLIELGAGFHPDLTGRENIYVQGALIGRSKDEMSRAFDAIVEFSELEDFIDLPVKNYSSGMAGRLGFSIFIHQNPDILLMDEVLAVGDFNFQQKCLAKVNEMRSQMAVLLVSHSMNAIRMFCDRVIVLEHGKLIFDDNPAAAISFYLEHERKATKNQDKRNEGTVDSGIFGRLIHNRQKIPEVEHRWSRTEYSLGDEMEFEFSFGLDFQPHRLIVGVPVWDEKGFCITAFNSDQAQFSFDPTNHQVRGRLRTSCLFNPGTYRSVFVVTDGTEFLYRQMNSSITVASKERVYGFVTFPQLWSTDD